MREDFLNSHRFFGDERMSGQFGPIGLVVRMAVRPPGRFCTRMLLLIIVSFFLSGALLLVRGMEEAADRGARRLGADLLVMPQGGDVVSPETPLLGAVQIRATLPGGVDAALAGMPGIVEVAPQYLSVSVADPCCDAGDLLLVGFDPSRDLTVLPWLRPGSTLPGDRDSSLVGWKVLKATGATMRFHGQPFRVAARLDKSGMSRFDTAVFIPFDGLRAMERSSGQGHVAPFSVVWGRPSLILARLAMSVNPREVAHTLENRFPGTRVVTAPEAVREQRQRLERIARNVRTVLLVAWPVAVLTGALLSGLVVRDRRRSLGLLRMFGCGRMLILLLFGAEAGILTLMAMAFGNIGAYAVLRLLAPVLTELAGLPLLSEALATAFPGILWSWLAFAGILTAVAAMMTLRMLRHETADLLRSSCG